MQRDFEFLPQPSLTAVARIVTCGDAVAIALPAHTTLEIVEHPQPVIVPGAAPHALGMLAWQGQRIALIDAAVLLADVPRRTTPPRYALVVAMQRAPGAPIEHGAIAIDALPETVTVNDAAACGLPPGDTWQRVAISCFTHAGQPVPIVDTAQLLG